MGVNFLDQYSYLHFSVGIVAYFWGLNVKNLIILHILFELFENHKISIPFINKYITFWPGGKPKADSLINSLGDILSCIVGWISAYYLDILGSKYGWYQKHIKFF